MEEKQMYCTLFDKHFIYRGLAMYHSLIRFDSSAMLYILCMDTEVYALLKRMNLGRIRLIKLSDFEDDRLKNAKQNRTIAEYCWTCGSSLMWYVLNLHPETKQVTYLDSDLYFFDSPQPIYDEMGENSILIMKHNYVPKFAYLEKLSGIYNVAMVIIKNDDRGRACLSWWRDRCLEWCYSRYEEGKFGDQKYLDDWPKRFEGVHVLRHKGADVAPWNVANYTVNEINGVVHIDEYPLIFYHFHSFKMYKKNSFKLFNSSYSITKDVERKIYSVYITALKSLINTVRMADRNFIYGFNKKPSIKESIREYAKKWYLICKNISIRKIT